MIKAQVLSSVAILTLLYCIVPTTNAGLITYDSEVDFLAAAPIVSTETFDGFATNYGFTHKVISLDGLIYSTESCTNRCWTFDSNYKTTPNSLISNSASTNTIMFGPSRWVEALGFWLLTGSSNDNPVVRWEILIKELDSTNTLVSVPTPLPPGQSYFGFYSDIGISKVLVRDFAGTSGASNWKFDNVSHSAILGGDPFPNCEPVAPPALGGPGNITGGSCVAGVAEPYDASEPATITLFCLGLAGLGFARRKKA